ncbi:SigE family RNA polymerase sigma factor, partial [Streptomyces scabiei]|nr:SigE family RNA polymerase sigma factor [Streptomyces scabiei]
MNTLHSTSTSAVVTRLHDVVRNTEKSGAVSGRGCARGTGRQHTTFMSVVDAHVGGSTTGVPGGRSLIQLSEPTSRPHIP